MVEKRKTSDNIKHYINELMDGNSFFTGNLIYKKAVISTAILHALAAILSLLAGSILMTIVNAVVFLLTAQYERSYAYFIVPLTAWLFAIVYTYYYKWKRRH
jgi:hypothetical protein